MGGHKKLFINFCAIFFCALLRRWPHKLGISIWWTNLFIYGYIQLLSKPVISKVEWRKMDNFIDSRECWFTSRTKHSIRTTLLIFFLRSCCARTCLRPNLFIIRNLKLALVLWSKVIHAIGPHIRKSILDFLCIWVLGKLSSLNCGKHHCNV